MDDHARGVLKRRLDDVEQEIADLGSLLTIMRHIERDERLRERLRTAQLDFRLQDVWAGRLRGDALRGALTQLERLATA
jgi:acetoacetate decarboxylase